MKKLTVIIAAFTVLAGLFSFSKPLGGEGFEIYLNNKLMLQQFGSQMVSTKSLHLDQRFADEQLTVKYYHCGQAGKNRHISIKDAQNRTLKDWSFANSKEPGLTFPVNEILTLQNGANRNSLNLYYSSSELPNGKLLVTIVPANQTKP